MIPLTKGLSIKDVRARACAEGVEPKVEDGTDH